MVEDNAISETRAAAGKKGGEATTLKTKDFAKANAQAKVVANSDNEDETENVFKEGGSGEGMDIDLLIEKIIRDKHYREQCENAGFPPAKLDQWMYAFNRFLKFKGVKTNTEAHWRLGFPAWMAYHDYRSGENPDDYNPVMWAKQKKEDADKILKQNGTHQQTFGKSRKSDEGAHQLLASLKADLGAGTGNNQD